MNYFLAPHERSYGDGTNLGTSYCQFLTRLPLAQCLIARSARGDVRWEAAYFVLARRRKSVSARSSSARRREHRGFDIVTKSGLRFRLLLLPGGSGRTDGRVSLPGAARTRRGGRWGYSR